MQGSSWTSVLAMIPAEQHSKLVVITHNNSEIHLQGILHQEPEFFVVRGRLAASTDAGRVFILPFDQVHYIAFRDAMKESDVLAMMGVPGAAAAAKTPDAPTAAATDTAEAEATSPAVPEPARKHGSGQISKAALLERLRRARGIDTGPRSGAV